MLRNSIIESINTIYIIEPQMKTNNNNKANINEDSEKQNIEVNTNNEIPINEEGQKKLLLPSLQK